MNKPFILLAATLFGTLAGLRPGCAEAQDTIRLRAIGPHANDPGIIRYIAQNAEPFPVPIPEADGPESPTVRSIIRARCGSVQRAYVEAFRRANPDRKTVALDQALSRKDSDLAWPACLPVALFPNVDPVKVRPNERAADVYKRLTGGGGSDTAVQKYFATIDPTIDTASLKEGAVLKVPYITYPVELATNQDIDTFWRGLEKAAKQSAYWLALEKTAADTVETNMIARLRTPDQGSVIVAVDSTCEPLKGAPYDAAAVKEAYERALARAKSASNDIQRARIVVVDNGFFGADPDKPRGKEFDDSPFPSGFFAREDGDSVVAKRLVLPGNSTIVFPINYSNRVPPTPVSGHGTHVVGLVLGGPSFLDYRDKLRGDESWAEITVLNVGAGRDTLIENAERLLANDLPEGGHIVNMSITYSGKAYNNVSATFDNLFRSKRNLYIVAAGNDGSEVGSKVYPAASGGPQAENVVTVAALDGAGRFTRFSNTGASTVDIAAPGCEIPSWIQNSKVETVLSGTSQATPLVTFAAALLRSFAGNNLDLRHIKTRLVVSGSLLDPVDQDFTAYRVRLNIQRALYWYDDYVRVGGTEPGRFEEYIGTVDRLSGLRCANSKAASAQDDIRAYKRGPLKRWLYLGKAASKLKQPCDAVENPGAAMAFTPVFRITPKGIEEVKQVQATYPLDSIEEVIFRSHPPR
jgi:subtilisin family serine protease